MATAAEPDEFRRQVDGRPLVMLGIGLVVGLTLLAHPANVIFLVVAGLLAYRWPPRVVLMVGAAAGLLLAPREPALLMQREYVQTVGSVVGVPRVSEFGTTFTLCASDRNWRVHGTPGWAIAMGDRVRVVGVGIPLREGSEQSLRLHGVTGRVEAVRLALVAPGPTLWRAASAWRSDFRKFCKKVLPAPVAALTEALCFDLNAPVDREVTRRLRDMGALHVVVASGLHVYLLAAAMFAVLGRLPVPRAVQIGMVAGVLLLYCGATGLTPAVVRASLAVVIGISAYLFRREPDALSAMALAAIAYLIWQPAEVYAPGFQLSYLAVGAIALFYTPRGPTRRQLMRLLYDFASLSAIAFLATAPLLAFYFGYISVVALPANLLIGGAAGVAIIAAFTAHALSGVVPTLSSALLITVTGPLVGWILVITDRLGGQTWSTFTVPAFSPYWLALLYGLLLMLWRPRIVQP